MHDNDGLHDANIIYEALQIAKPTQEFNSTRQTKSHHPECQLSLGCEAEDRAKSAVQLEMQDFQASLTPP